MITVYKYTLRVLDHQVLMLPEGADILTVQVQRGELVLWALVDPDRPSTERHIRIIGTGHPIQGRQLRHGGSGRRHPYLYLCTVQMYQGDLVWHIFEAEGNE